MRLVRQYIPIGTSSESQAVRTLNHTKMIPKAATALKIHCIRASCGRSILGRGFSVCVTEEFFRMLQALSGLFNLCTVRSKRVAAECRRAFG